MAADVVYPEHAKTRTSVLRSARDESGLGITVSYWQDEAAIAGWRKNVEHTESRRRGRAEWYEEYDVRVARVERSYGFERAPGH